MAGANPSSRSSLEAPDGRNSTQRPGISTLQSPEPYGGHGLYTVSDPRASSAQSLVPSLPEYEEFARRKLLIIYIHGFMGNDTSFQSFPLHVHRYLKDALAETHVIHSKIYPRYKTYKAIDVARDNFSRWLQPHESPTTDVILVGHSMGGLLAADVILMPGQQPQQTYLRHRILGAVHLDSPILGLHPGIVVSGISSLFRAKPEKPGSPTSPGAQLGATGSQSDVLSPTQSLYSESSFDSQTTAASSIPPPGPGFAGARTMDPNFDPSFPNDVRLKDRSWWKNVVHFAKKHSSEGLIDAATKHLMSHLEFGSCLMDFGGLKARYENVRKLEDVDDIKNYGFPHVPPQVRFVQYYTVCYGFPKVPKSPKVEESQPMITQSLDSVVVADSKPATESADKREAPKELVQASEHSTLNVNALGPIPKEAGSPSHRSVSDWSASELEMLEPEPILDDEPLPSENKNESTGLQTTTSQPDAGKEDVNTRAESSASSILEKPSEGASAVEKPDGEATSPSPPRIVQESATGTLTDLMTATSALSLDLPAIPEPPSPPELPDLEKFTDKDARKLAEKESKRLLKAYEQAVKDRNKAIKERDKIIEKRQKKLAQEAEKREKEAQKQAKQAEKQMHKDEAEEAKRQAEAKAVADAENIAQSAAAAATLTDEQLSPQNSNSGAAELSTDHSQAVAEGARSPPAAEQENKPPKKLKERKFINMPSKINGQPDPKWVKIFMKDMDETAAHTSLFFPGEHYEKLVGDVGELIMQWVQYDLTKKAIMGWSEG
ncbi:uncharacterized protein B0I36DRAFT_105792 [Microdochium trichocladiopsis]|uniref:DUF676 domain-containing protein n=1 Tax=Microdochium trichocladiopsis TaxID=1682393 RepID=A0A9P8Y9C5_9PEZI|nr:uncharacterized protein B0I36DRAFT_105792 [Microdochium trichocladiopsis]KAH7033170.1 hypothetical protein B0I36DRAFT_105792 [Microdochium trichocladiopsis]